ncbi:hypothetical protein N0V82_001143 [Gnomoniopsis sp. IMI 355080]|nr:hypothetical protein N0V82_001143 [Gnomoniopsis sp. IMI 355080]
MAGNQPSRDVGTETPGIISTQEAPQPQEKMSKEQPIDLKPKSAKASLYHEMQQWQDRLDLVTHAWVYDDIKEPIEKFVHEPDLPVYYKMVALLARCLPEPEPEPKSSGEEEEVIEKEMDAERQHYMAEAQKAYDECLTVYTRAWDLESVQEAWSTWPN